MVDEVIETINNDGIPEQYDGVGIFSEKRYGAVNAYQCRPRDNTSVLTRVVAGI